MSGTNHIAFAARFPSEVGEVITNTVRRIERGRITGCPHLEAEPVAFVCHRHPVMLRCTTCADDHVRTHNRHEEHDCDICGEYMPDTTATLMSLVQPVEVDALLPIGHGHTAAVGLVVFIGWGACIECLTAVQS